MHLSVGTCTAVAVLALLAVLPGRQAQEAVAPPTAAAWTPPVECENPYIRKEFRDYTDDERKRFVAAMKGVMKRPSPDEPSVYDRIAMLHHKYADKTHGTPIFHPYHRVLVHRVETEIRKEDDSFTMPYWESSLDSQAPEASLIFSDDWLGGNGVGTKNCVRNGQFRDFVPFYQDGGGRPTCLRRKFDNGTKMKPLAAVELVESIVGNTQNFTRFRKRTEGFLHARVHNGVGGMMRSMHSPNDPIFYLHHAYMDKIWDDWQRRDAKKRLYQFDGRDNKTGKVTKMNEFLPPPVRTLRVGDAMNTRANGMCYKYAEPEAARNAAQPATGKKPKRKPKLKRRSVLKSDADSDLDSDADNKAHEEEEDDDADEGFSEGARYKRAPPAGDRSFIAELRPPAKIPTEWAIMNGVDLEDLRADEKEAAHICDELNKLEGYVSRSALWNRPDLLRAIAREQSVFRVHIHGRVVNVSSRDIEDGVDRDSDEHLERIKRKFMDAGMKVVKSVRQQARKLRRILGGGVDILIERFEKGLAEFSPTAKQIYDKTKKALFDIFDVADEEDRKKKQQQQKQSAAYGEEDEEDAYDEGDGELGLAREAPTATTGAKPCDKKKPNPKPSPVVVVKKPCNKTRPAEPSPIASPPRPEPTAVVSVPVPAPQPKAEHPYSEDEPEPLSYSEDEPTPLPHSEDEADQAYSEEEPAEMPAINYTEAADTVKTLLAKSSSAALVSGQKSDVADDNSFMGLGAVASDQPSRSD